MLVPQHVAAAAWDLNYILLLALFTEPLLLSFVPVDGQYATSGIRSRGQEDGVWADPVPVHSSGCLQVIHKEQAQLGDHIYQAKPFTDLQADREVICKLCREEQLCIALDSTTYTEETEQSTF